jgi:hypothetical protein
MADQNIFMSDSSFLKDADQAETVLPPPESE